MNIPTLDGPNWGQCSIHLQAAAHILDCWNVIKGEALGTTPQTFDLLAKPTPLGVQASTTDLAAYNTAQTIWNKKNAQALGLMQATVSPVIWQDFVTYSKAQEPWDALEAQFGKAGGATTYLQLVNWLTVHN